MKTFTDPKEYGPGAISWTEEGRLPPPFMHLYHVDGPCIVFSDGQMHWLSLWDRLILALGLTDAELLQWKHRPNLCAAFGIKTAIPRIGFYRGEDYLAMSGYRVFAVYWGKQYTVYDKAMEGYLTHKHRFALRWLSPLRLEWY